MFGHDFTSRPTLLPQHGHRGVDDGEAARIETGAATFRAIGDAACHLPSLGGVAGLYSDLLLHDMGPGLGDTGTYGVFAASVRTHVVSRPRILAWMRRTFAAAFVALGAKLALSER